MDALSIIIPTYNRADLLGRAIESVMRQRTFCGELVIVDDGSTDHTADVVRSFETAFPIVYRSYPNAGPAAARNRGVALSSFEHVAFLDSDDHWMPDKLALQMEALRRHPGHVVSHTWEKWLRRGRHLNQKDIHRPRHGDIFAHCLKLCAVGMSTVVMKKQAFLEAGGFDVSMPCCEDYDLWLRISSRFPFLLVPLPLTVKEGGRPDQLSVKYRLGMDRYRIYAIDKLLAHHPLSNAQRKLAIAELRRKAQVYGRGCIKHGREEEGLRYLQLPEKYHQPERDEDANGWLE